MVVGNFSVNGTNYVVVRMVNSVHVMPEKDWIRTSYRINFKK